MPHTLGTGAKIGPDLTGSNRGNLDYLLENMRLIRSVIPEYAVTLFELNSGRFVTGFSRKNLPWLIRSSPPMKR